MTSFVFASSARQPLPGPYYAVAVLVALVLLAVAAGVAAARKKA